MTNYFINKWNELPLLKLGVLSLLAVAVCFAVLFYGSSGHLEVLPREVSRTDSFCVSTLSYPEFHGGAKVAELNSAVKALIEEELQKFRDSYKDADTAGQKGSFSCTYDVTLNTSSIVSIEFDMQFEGPGAAQSQDCVRTINYSVKDGKVLQLKDVFLKDIPYADILTVLSFDHFVSSPESPGFGLLLDGLKPIDSTYKNFSLSSDGMLISFDQDEIASSAEGVQSVLIPYDSISNLLEKRLIFALPPSIRVSSGLHDKPVLSRETLNEQLCDLVLKDAKVVVEKGGACAELDVFRSYWKCKGGKADAADVEAAANYNSEKPSAEE